MLTQRSTQASGAVPTLLCNLALKVQEESCPRRLKGKLAEPPGLLICRPKTPMDYSEGISSSSTSWMQFANSRSATKSHHPRTVGKRTCRPFGVCPRQANFLRVAFVNKLGAEQSLLGRRVPIGTQSSDSATRGRPRRRWAISAATTVTAQGPALFGESQLRLVRHFRVVRYW